MIEHDEHVCFLMSMFLLGYKGEIEGLKSLKISSLLLQGSSEVLLDISGCARDIVFVLKSDRSVLDTLGNLAEALRILFRDSVGRVRSSESISGHLMMAHFLTDDGRKHLTDLFRADGSGARNLNNLQRTIRWVHEPSRRFLSNVVRRNHLHLRLSSKRRGEDSVLGSVEAVVEVGEKRGWPQEDEGFLRAR